MGKLHTLKRAILRDPQKWRGASRAYFRDGQWHPTSSYGWWMGDPSYRQFIRHTLKNIGQVGSADSRMGS